MQDGVRAEPGSAVSRLYYLYYNADKSKTSTIPTHEYHCWHTIYIIIYIYVYMYTRHYITIYIYIIIYIYNCVYI